MDSLIFVLDLLLVPFVLTPYVFTRTLNHPGVNIKTVWPYFVTGGNGFYLPSLREDYARLDRPAAAASCMSVRPAALPHVQETPVHVLGASAVGW